MSSGVLRLCKGMLKPSTTRFRKGASMLFDQGIVKPKQDDSCRAAIPVEFVLIDACEDGEFYIQHAPPCRSGEIVAELEHVGRARPIPIDDPQGRSST